VVTWREIEGYEVRVSMRMNRAGEDVWSDPVAYFLDERNALAMKRQLEAQGHRAIVNPYRLTYSEESQKHIFRDYES
jgi:hypothetical protein